MPVWPGYVELPARARYALLGTAQAERTWTGYPYLYRLRWFWQAIYAWLGTAQDKRSWTGYAYLYVYAGLGRIYAGPGRICVSGQDMLPWARYAIWANYLGKICVHGQYIIAAQDMCIWAGYAGLGSIC